MPLIVNRPPSDGSGPDPDYDELWDLVFKLDTLLACLVVAGASTDEALILAGATEEEMAALRFTSRDQMVLAAVGRAREIVPA